MDMAHVLGLIIVFLAVVIVLINMFQQSTRPSNPIRTQPIRRPTNRGNWWGGWDRWWYPPRTGGPSRPSPSPERPTIPNPNKPQPGQCNSDSDCGTGQVCKLNRGGYRSCERGQMNTM
jgi:Cys-rich repeat protein